MIDPEELYVALNEAAERHGFAKFLTDADFEVLVRAVMELPVGSGPSRTREPLTTVQVRTRNPEHYELINHADGTRWRIQNGHWARNDGSPVRAGRDKRASEPERPAHLPQEGL